MINGVTDEINNIFLDMAVQIPFACGPKLALVAGVVLVGVHQSRVLVGQNCHNINIHYILDSTLFTGIIRL